MLTTVSVTKGMGRALFGCLGGDDVVVRLGVIGGKSGGKGGGKVEEQRVLDERRAFLKVRERAARNIDLDIGSIVMRTRPSRELRSKSTTSQLSKEDHCPIRMPARIFQPHSAG